MRAAFQAVALWLVAVGSAAAQTVPLENRPPSQQGAQAVQQTGLVEFFSGRTPYEFWLTLLIILFGLTVIGLVLWFFRGTAEQNGDRIVRALIVVVIVVSTLVLITAGYSNEQVAPAFGLFGTIIGYILGRLSSAQAQTPEHEQKTANGQPGAPVKPGG